MPSLMDLPEEVREMILQHCVKITKRGQSGDSGTYVPPDLNEDRYWPSYTTPHFADADLCGIKNRQHNNYKIEDLSVLYVCRQLYREAVPLMYATNRFQFNSVTALYSFAGVAFCMGNHMFVREIVIRINLWEERSREMINEWKECEDHYLDWQQLLVRKGLYYYFPSLRHLVLDFAPETYHLKFLGFQAYVDGWASKLGSDRPPYTFPGLTMRIIGSYGRQPGFDAFREVLKKYVRVKEVTVHGLEGYRLNIEMEREMLRLPVQYGPLTESYYPREMYAEKPGLKLVLGPAREPYHVAMTEQEIENERGWSVMHAPDESDDSDN
ncbi:hypothetical protein MMC18_005100 [Xylographa bjoerkii]|nr:hypothetical protein [Xylographa bjoerkii]